MSAARWCTVFDDATGRLRTHQPLPPSLADIYSALLAALGQPGVAPASIDRCILQVVPTERYCETQVAYIRTSHRTAHSETRQWYILIRPTADAPGVAQRITQPTWPSSISN